MLIVGSDEVWTRACVECTYNLARLRLLLFNGYGDLVSIILKKAYLASPRKCQDVFVWFVRLLVNILDKGIHCLLSPIVSTGREVYHYFILLTILDALFLTFPGGRSYSLRLGEVVVYAYLTTTAPSVSTFFDRMQVLPSADLERCAALAER